MEGFVRPVKRLSRAQWKLPLVCALLLHLVILFGSFYGSDIFKKKPKFARVQTVNLVNLAVPAASTKPPSPVKKQAQAAKPQPSPTTKTEAKKTAPIVKKKTVKKKMVAAETTVKSTPVDNAPPKKISLNPKRKKIKKKVAPSPKPVVKKQSKTDREEARKRAQELARRIRQEALLEKQAQLAEAQARLAEQALREERALLEKAQKTSTLDSFPSQPQKTDTTTQRGGAAGGRSNIIADRYYATVKGIIQSHWALPPNLEKKRGLQAVVVIKINQNGQILDMFFEQKSPNTMFNQFVTNSINASTPLPPIPAALGVTEIEFGTTFSQEGVN